MKEILYQLAGWHDCDIDTYRLAYEKFGGSVCTHPDIIAFLNEKKQLNLKFKCRYKNGEVSASLYHHNNQLSLADKHLPIVFDDVLLPVSDEERFFLPCKSKRLSPLLKDNIRNALYCNTLKHKVCYIKEQFSNKTIRKRNGELNRFLQSGGSFRSVNTFSDKEICDIYIGLFNARWKHRLRCWPEAKLLETISTFRPLLFGSVLLFNDVPCAFDLLFKAECAQWIYFDDINGGYDADLCSQGTGSILLWKNITDAQALCSAQRKTMIFSLGAYLKGWDYKHQWCEILASGRTIGG